MPITGTELDTIAVDTSAGSGDHGKIVLLGTDGLIDSSMLPDFGSGTITTIANGNGISVSGGTGPTATVSASFGTSSTTVCAGNDSRLSDSRTPTGTAGGDLAGTYPNPTVAKIHETGGPTALTIGAVADGKFLMRSGSTIVGAAGGADGTTWYWYATSEVMSDSDGVEGDFAIIVDGPEGNGNIYQHIGGHWTAIGNIRGGDGIAGTQIRSGTTAPDDAVGVNGDFYLRTDTGQFYKRVGGTYTLVLTMQLSGDNTANGLRTATTIVSISAATAPSSGQVLTATSSTAATWQTPTGGVSLTSNAPANVTAATAVVGTGTAAARDDHKHNISTGTPSTLTVGGSNTAGSATSLALSDHVHALPAFGSTSGTFCQGTDSRLSDDRTTTGLRSATTVVSVSAATAPSTGQVLTATDSTHATWQTAAGGAASDLATTGSNVNVSAAAPPSAGKVLTATDATHATWQTPTSGGTSNPFLDAPGSPHTDNDEFTGWSGWTVYDVTANANLTDDGDGSIDPWTYPSSGHYRRKTVGTYILLQFPKSTNSINIYKSITPASSMLLWSRFASGANFNDSGINSFLTVEFGVFQNNSGRPKNSTDGFTMVGSTNPSNNTGRKITSVQQGTSQVNALTFGAGVSVPDIFGVYEVSTTNRHTFLVDSKSGDFQIDNSSPYGGTQTTAYAGWRVVPSNTSTSGGACPILTIDYFRRKDSSTAWIV